MQVLSQKTSVHHTITRKIADAIQSGAGPYKMPWHSDQGWMALPINVVTEAYYRGVNVLSLWIDAKTKGFTTSHWATYRQWRTLGAQVRKGERGSVVIFYKRMEAGEEASPAHEAPARHFLLRAFYVFNAAQVDGWAPPLPLQLPSFEIDKQVEAFVSATGARVRHGFANARYRLDLDDIEMPSPAWFFDSPTSSASQSYHAVLLHELIHWSGASHRIGREFGKRFGDRTYAFEELVAELGAAFLCAAFGISNEPRPDHAAYVRSWLEILGHDTKAIFTAASKAQEAVEYLSAMATENAR
jgi:antirestriction protein ArdC